MERPALKRKAVEYAVQHYGISRRRACRIVKQHRRMQYYRSCKDPTTALFNGSLRDECLNVHWFETLEDAVEKVEAWRVEYNESRPHQALGELTPARYAEFHRTSEKSEELQNAGN
jgi:transposase InsO family protein